MSKSKVHIFSNRLKSKDILFIMFEEMHQNSWEAKEKPKCFTFCLEATKAIIVLQQQIYSCTGLQQSALTTA